MIRKRSLACNALCQLRYSRSLWATQRVDAGQSFTAYCAGAGWLCVWSWVAVPTGAPSLLDGEVLRGSSKNGFPGERGVVLHQDGIVVLACVRCSQIASMNQSGMLNVIFLLENGPLQRTEKGAAETNTDRTFC